MGTSGAKRGGAGTWRYLKEAFLYHWNLLVFGGAAAAALISGAPEVALPLVMAGELVYLTGLVGNDRFRAAIDVKAHKEANPPAEVAATRRQESLATMVQGLGPAGRERFLDLRRRCQEMGVIASGVSGRTGARAGKGIDRQTLDRLLWAFLRLLYSEQALASFLDTTDKDEIVTQLERMRARVEQSAGDGDERVLRSLRDSVATGELRLANYEQAERNAEFVDLELQRIDGKIRALTELAVSTEDPDIISSQVDSVAEDMASTERAIRQIQHLTGLDDGMSDAPSIMDAEVEELWQA